MTSRPRVSRRSWAGAPLALPALLALLRRLAGGDDDGAGHLRVDRAEVAIGAWLRELPGEAIVGIEHRRFELLFCADDRMRDVVVIGPDHASAGRDGEFGRPEAEVVDAHVVTARRRRCRPLEKGGVYNRQSASGRLEADVSQPE